MVADARSEFEEKQRQLEEGIELQVANGDDLVDLASHLAELREELERARRAVAMVSGVSVMPLITLHCVCVCVCVDRCCIEVPWQLISWLH